MLLLDTHALLWFVRAHRCQTRYDTPAIAAATASVPATCGRGDPGDCFLVATARVRRLSLVTRDGSILRLARERLRYMQMVGC